MLATPDGQNDVIDTAAEQFELASANGLILIILIIGILLYTALMAWLFTRALLQAQSFPAPFALVTALTLLTFVALTSAIVTDSAAIETIAATGMGAIAGALSHVFTAGDAKNERKSVPDESHQEAEEDVPGMHDPEE